MYHMAIFVRDDTGLKYRLGISCINLSWFSPSTVATTSMNLRKLLILCASVPSSVKSRVIPDSFNKHLTNTYYMGRTTNVTPCHFPRKRDMCHTKHKQFFFKIYKKCQCFTLMYKRCKLLV